MANTRNLQANTDLNFILRGTNSIQIGIYFLVAAYLFQSIFSGFLSDSSLIGMMSIEIIESMLIAITVLFFAFAYFALYFSNRRVCRKHKTLFWNSITKVVFFVTTVLSIVTIIALSYLNSQGLFLDITPVFLILYGSYLLLFNFRKKQQLYYLGSLSILLAILCFLIPTYWYSSIFILGVGHIIYGIVVKK